MAKIIVFTQLLLISLLGTAAAKKQEDSASPPKSKPIIAFFNPSDSQNSYWPPIFQLIEEAGDDLGFEFLHFDLGYQDRLASERKIKEVLDSHVTPDAIMVSTTINSARRILDSPETKNSILIFEGPLFPSELKTLGQKEKKLHPNWLGFFEQDEEKKGYLLAKLLIEKARQQKSFAKDGKIHLLGVGGSRNWYGSTLREAGLKKALVDSPDVLMNQLIPANWSADRARDLSLKMLDRFPETSVIWAASDQMAEGALEAFKKKGRKLGLNAFVGGPDLSEIGLREVMNGNFVATVGSPCSFYAKVAVYLYDSVTKAMPLIHDIKLTSEVYAVTKANVEEFIHIKAVEHAIDFRDFSLHYHPELKTHDFSWPALVKAACRNKAKFGRSPGFASLCLKSP